MTDAVRFGSDRIKFPQVSLIMLPTEFIENHLPVWLHLIIFLREDDIHQSRSNKLPPPRSETACITLRNLISLSQELVRDLVLSEHAVASDAAISSAQLIQLRSSR
jgi:hypothetical protein